MITRTPTQLARGFLTDAEAYLRAAQKLDQSHEGLASAPQYYLACHSIELILKSFILTKGGTEREVVKMRHDLQKAWDRATELGLHPKDKRTGEVIGMLAPLDPRHDLLRPFASPRASLPPDRGLRVSPRIPFALPRVLDEGSRARTAQ